MKKSTRDPSNSKKLAPAKDTVPRKRAGSPFPNDLSTANSNNDDAVSGKSSSDNREDLDNTEHRSNGVSNAADSNPSELERTEDISHTTRSSRKESESADTSGSSSDDNDSSDSDKETGHSVERQSDAKEHGGSTKISSKIEEKRSEIKRDTNDDAPKSRRSRSRSPRRQRSRSPEDNRNSRKADRDRVEQRDSGISSERDRHRKDIRPGESRRQESSRSPVPHRGGRDRRSPRRRKSRSRSRDIPDIRRKDEERERPRKRTGRDGPDDDDEDDAEKWFASKRTKIDKLTGPPAEEPTPDPAAPAKPKAPKAVSGVYIPPAKMKMLQAKIEDKSSEAYQRLEWEQLKKKIMGKVNKVNVENIKEVVYELLMDNVVRGKGLLARAVIQAQAFSPSFSNVYAALVAVINSKFPHIGELIVRRLVVQFKRAFRRNDKTVAITATKFLAHLINQQVIHEVLALEILCLLVSEPSDDSVEVAIAFIKECGAKLENVCKAGLQSIFDELRHLLPSTELSDRVKYMIEVAIAVRKDHFNAHPSLVEDLDLVEEADQITHTVALEDKMDPENKLNIFKFDTEFEKNEEMYAEIRAEILGEDDSEDESEEEGDAEGGTEEKTTIIDNTETNLVAFRRTTYLTIQSSLTYDECVHKLMQMQIKPGMEVELCNMILDACCQLRTYEQFYGLVAERLCRMRREYQQHFEELFKGSYDTVHRLDSTKLRICARFFAALLHTDAISWKVRVRRIIQG